MSEQVSVSSPPSGLCDSEIAVVRAGDYVNKHSGQRIERECLLRIECGCRALVIDFKGTELVNSIGVSILLGVIDMAEQISARIVFSNVSLHTVKLFELLGLTRLVAMAESEEAALATLKEFAPPPNGH